MELTLDQALQKGIEAHKAGNIREADRFYTAVIRAQPSHPDANHNLGVLAVGVGKLEEALSFFKTALEANKTVAQFWLSYIDTLLKLDRKEEARELFLQAKNVGAKGDTFDKLEKQLNIEEFYKDQLKPLLQLYTQGHFQDTIKETQALSKRYPYNPGIWNLLGASAAKLGQVDHAINAFQAVLKLQPSNANAYNNLGAMFKDLGQLGKAIENYQKALQLDPKHAEGYFNLGNALKEQKNLSEAIYAYEKALKIKPNYADAYVNMGNTYRDIGDLQKAAENYNRALILVPDLTSAYTNAVELLKAHTPKHKSPHLIFTIDRKIKKLSSRLIKSVSPVEVTSHILEGFSYIDEDRYTYRTPLTQIYKRTNLDLNCDRHKKIFETLKIIPEFCFGCFKVQIEVPSMIDLIKITSLFYKIQFGKNLMKKTMIELRENVPGFYKGIIYCGDLDEAKVIKQKLDLELEQIFEYELISAIKRGCSEYALEYPTYGKVENTKGRMSYPNKWRNFEERFDQTEIFELNKFTPPTTENYSLGDFYIIQKWIDYAKGIGDTSVDRFIEYPIHFPAIYETAKIRSSA